jgi:hypothetical protein
VGRVRLSRRRNNPTSEFPPNPYWCSTVPGLPPFELPLVAPLFVHTCLPEVYPSGALIGGGIGGCIDRSVAERSGVFVVGSSAAVGCWLDAPMGGWRRHAIQFPRVRSWRCLPWWDILLWRPSFTADFIVSLLNTESSTVSGSKQ